MGLLNSVFGALLGGNGAQTQGGLAGMIGALANNPQMLQAITGMLANDGSQGGLGGLMQKFQQAGMGDVIASWVGSGENKAISGAQLS
ncbi:MAG: YidB family protein, partial [Rhodoferax sp.]|nr:YidB family protein [Rhodoferax sp.]